LERTSKDGTVKKKIVLEQLKKLDRQSLHKVAIPVEIVVRRSIWTIRIENSGSNYSG